MYGNGVSGSMFTTLSSLVGIIATVSNSGPRSRSGWTSAAPSLAVPMKADLDQDERPAAEMVGQERSIRQLQHATEGFALVGHGLDPLAPGVQDLRCALDRPEQGPGVDLARPGTARARARSRQRRCRLRRGAPRTARARCRGRSGRRRPSAVTTSAATMLLQASPNFRIIQLRPPPSAYPSTPTSGDVPAR